MIRCHNCQSPISAQRLKARPYARLCIQCQSRADVPLVTAWSRQVAKSLVESSLSDLDELGKQTRELLGGSE